MSSRVLKADVISSMERSSAAAQVAVKPTPEHSFPVAGANITRNFASLVFGRFGAQVLAFLTNAYLARRIAPSGFGAIGLAQSVIGYLNLFSDSGLSVIAVREGAQDRSKINHLIGSITGLRVLLAGILLPIGLLAAEYLPLSEDSRNVLRIFALSLPLQALAVDWVFRALQRMHFAAVTQVFTAALTLVLAMACVRGPQHLLRVPWLGLLTTCCAFLLSIYLLARAGYRRSITFRLRESKRYLTQAFPMCAASVAISLYVQANYLILGMVHGDAEVGMYAAASRAAGVFFTVTVLYFSAMAPALMELYSQSRQRAAAMLTESVRLTAVAGCGLAAVGAFGSGLVLTRVFGPAFAPAKPTLVVLVCSGGVVAVSNNWAQLALAAHRERLIMWATAAGGVANIIVCVLLVHRYAGLGAAVGNLVAEVVGGAIMILAWPRDVGLGALRAALVPVMLAGIAVLVGIQIGRLMGQFWASSCVAALYIVGLIATRTLTPRDIRRLVGALRPTLPPPPEAVAK